MCIWYGIERFNNIPTLGKKRFSYNSEVAFWNFLFIWILGQTCLREWNCLDKFCYGFGIKIFFSNCFLYFWDLKLGPHQALRILWETFSRTQYHWLARLPRPHIIRQKVGLLPQTLEKQNFLLVFSSLIHLIEWSLHRNIRQKFKTR